MAYERVNWENLPSTKTPVNADNLNKLNDAIDQAGAEIFVGTEEPTAGEKVWFNKNKNSIYVRNSNGVYEEFTKQIKKELLWENSTNSALPATDITLSSDDYDELEVQYCASSLYAVGDKSEIVTKNRSIQLSASLYDSDHKCMLNVSRLIKRNSDTSFSAEIAYYTNLTTPYSGIESRFCIPLKIYGIKRR